MMTPEAKVKKAIKTFLTQLAHCWFCVPNAGGYGVAGIPDILVCYRGFFLAIEVKAPGKLKGTTPLQQTQLRAINNAMGFALVADDVRMVRDAIKNIDVCLAIMALATRGAFEPEDVVSRIAA